MISIQYLEALSAIKNRGPLDSCDIGDSIYTLHLADVVVLIMHVVQYELSYTVF